MGNTCFMALWLYKLLSIIGASLVKNKASKEPHSRLCNIFTTPKIAKKTCGLGIFFAGNRLSQIIDTLRYPSSPLQRFS